MSDLDKRVELLEQQVRELTQMVEHISAKIQEISRDVVPPEQLGEVYAAVRIALTMQKKR